MASTDITVSRNELQAAIRRMAAKTGNKVSESLALQLAVKIKTFMQATKEHQAYPFKVALRYGLNELRVVPFERSAYRAVMGSYFGTHGAHVAAKNKVVDISSRRKLITEEQPSLEVFVEWNGQLAFRV